MESVVDDSTAGGDMNGRYLRLRDNKKCLANQRQTSKRGGNVEPPLKPFNDLNVLKVGTYSQAPCQLLHAIIKGCQIISMLWERNSLLSNWGEEIYILGEGINPSLMSQSPKMKYLTLEIFKETTISGIGTPVRINSANRHQRTSFLGSL